MPAKLIVPLFGSTTTPNLPANTSQTSAPVDIRTSDLASVTFDLEGMTGTISATATVQVSNDLPPQGGSLMVGWVPAASSWVSAVDINGNALTATLTATGAVMLSTNALNQSWLRAQYVYVTGVGGTISANLTTKTTA